MEPTDAEHPNQAARSQRSRACLATPQGEWTYEDWCKFSDDGHRCEAIAGLLYVSPPPSIRHQRISIALVRHLLDFLLSQVAVAWRGADSARWCTIISPASASAT